MLSAAPRAAGRAAYRDSEKLNQPAVDGANENNSCVSIGVLNRSSNFLLSVSPPCPSLAPCLLHVSLLDALSQPPALLGVTLGSVVTRSRVTADTCLSRRGGGGGLRAGLDAS